MYLFLRFIHIVAAMVLLGLPLSLPRFRRSLALVEKKETLRAGLRQMQALFGYLYTALALVLLTGTGMLHLAGRGFGPFFHLSFTGLILLTLNLVVLHRRLREALRLGSMQPLHRPFVLFSIVHHTLSTALTATMVFRLLL